MHVARFPPKKILVPIDVSDESLIAWKQAKALAEIFSAKVEGLYAQEWVYVSYGFAPASPLLTTEVTKSIVAGLRERIGQDADLHAHTGAASETILSWAARRAFDLIVMGTHGRTGLERAIKGSVAETIVRNSTIPVFVARQATAEVGVVLAPVCFQPYAWQGLLYAARIAAAFKARLVVLHVVDSPVYGRADALKGPKSILADFVDRLPEPLRDATKPKMQIAFGDPARQIVSASKDADLVVMMAHRKGFLSDHILGTTAERVLRHAAKSVLAIPYSAAARKPRRHARVAAHA